MDHVKPVTPLRSLSIMSSTRIFATFVVPIITFLFLADSAPLDLFDKEDETKADSFYAKLCSGVFDNESVEERVVDRTFECQSLYLVSIHSVLIVFSSILQPESMRRCVLDLYNLTTYPWNVSIGKISRLC